MKTLSLRDCVLFAPSVVFTLVLAIISPAFAADPPSEHLSLDANWKFHLGNDWPDALSLAKAGESHGPASEKFSDSGWRTVNLPHDWAIELPFDQNADGNHGFKPIGPGFPANSTGWYRRKFDLSAADAGKRIWLTFDGAFRYTTVWVNGWLVTRHDSGYYPFRQDITDFVRFGGTNTIAVRVDVNSFEGWFYEGAGLYRHVWLDKTEPVAIAPDGIFVRSTFPGNVPQGSPAVNVDVDLLNHYTNATDATVSCQIMGPDSQPLNQFTVTTNVPAADHIIAQLASSVASPILWSPESPNLYRLVTTVSVDNQVVDQKETVFGLRTVAFDPDQGFMLNGHHYELYGTCNHQDMAGVGAALPDALQYFRIKKLKEFGCNAYRTSHNPPTPELLDACDHLGMIVMDENRLLGSDDLNLTYLRTQVLRDRNHPSVGLWSLANEEFTVEDSPQGGRVAGTMQSLVKRLDPTRPITYAAPEGDTFNGINGVIEVRGWNYHPGGEMDSYHSRHPNQPNVGTEQASTVCTRGIYEDDAQRGYVSAYDIRGTQTAELWWSYFATRPWLSGGFVWTGFDYRGEPTPYWWPCVNSHFGILDTCGFPKDNFWYYQSWWTTNVVLHVMPHWNWPGREGKEIRVDALSNCKQVELFLNGESLGKKTMAPNSKLSWQVKYAPGTLSARGYDDNGQLIAQTQVETTGPATQIQLTPDRPTINADGEDVSVFTVSALDDAGRIVPVAMNKINFALEGPGRILGVGNGDPSCHEPDTYVPQLPYRTLRLGEWRYLRTHLPPDATAAHEYAPDFDDSSWTSLVAHKDGDGMFLGENETAIFRAHLHLTAADLDNPSIQIQFGSIDDHGWIYVNQQHVGESHDWSAEPMFEIKQALHEGDNVIAVGVKNDGGPGGMNPDVKVNLVGRPTPTPWSRSLFNGLAQVLVQSSKDPGQIILTATADGLKPASSTLTTAAGLQRPSVP